MSDPRLTWEQVMLPLACAPVQVSGCGHPGAVPLSTTHLAVAIWTVFTTAAFTGASGAIVLPSVAAGVGAGETILSWGGVLTRKITISKNQIRLRTELKRQRSRD